MSEIPNNYGVLMLHIETLRREVEEQKEHIAKLEARAERNDRERAAQEKKQLMAGISFLGAMVLAMATLIWSYRSVILKGGM